MHSLFAAAVLLTQDGSKLPTELSKGGIELKAAFANAEGKLRLLVIVSPG